MRENADFTVSSIPSDRLIYLMPSYRDVEDYVLAAAGGPLQPNRCRDWGAGGARRFRCVNWGAIQRPA